MPLDKSVPPMRRFRRLFNSFRPMQKVATATFVLFSTLACAREPTLLTSISGLWQFAENNVWIQIDEKGAAYQCRIGREGTVFPRAVSSPSRGTFGGRCEHRIVACKECPSINRSLFGQFLNVQRAGDRR
jgi:hypothetical protein